MRDVFNKEITDIIEDIFSTVIEQNQYTQYEILENDEGYIVEIYLAGAKKEDFEINLDGELFTISYRGDSEKEKEGYKYHRKRPATKSFKKKFRISKKLDLDKVSAEYKDGILKVIIPKAEDSENKPFNIKVK